VKGLLPALCALSLLLACGAPEPGDFRLDTPDGRSLSFASLRGRPLWLEYLTPWDPASRQRLADLPALAAQAPPSLRLLVVLDQEPEIPLPQGLETALDLGGEARRRLRIPVAPTTLLLDARGRQVSRLEGYAEPWRLLDFLRQAGL
jgi:hypothetical protein